MSHSPFESTFFLSAIAHTIPSKVSSLAKRVSCKVEVYFLKKLSNSCALLLSSHIGLGYLMENTLTNLLMLCFALTSNGDASDGELSFIYSINGLKPWLLLYVLSLLQLFIWRVGVPVPNVGTASPFRIRSFVYAMSTCGSHSFSLRSQIPEIDFPPLFASYGRYFKIPPGMFNLN